MKLKYVTLAIVVIMFFVFLSNPAKIYLSNLEAKNTFFNTVNNVDGNLLVLADNSKVLLAGAYIPRKEDYNYFQGLEENIKKILLGKRFKFKKILSKNIRYPKYDLLNAYDDTGKCINAELLEKGQAFFDNGYYPGKNLYGKLEQKAKEQNLGVWQNKQNLKVLFVTSRYWWDFHYPECPLVQNIKSKDRVEYYIWPTPIFFYRDPADCRYCRDIEVKFKRPKLFTYSEQDYLEDIRKEKEAAKNKTSSSKNAETPK